MVNTAFINYFDSLEKLTNSLKFPFLLNRTTYEQTLPICLQSDDFDSYLLKAPKALKDSVHQFQHKNKIFHLEEGHINNDLDLPNKNFFLTVILWTSFCL